MTPSAIASNLDEPKILLFVTSELSDTHFRLLTILKKRAFENTVEIGENAGDQYFLLFPQTFPLISRRISVF